MNDDEYVIQKNRYQSELDELDGGLRGTELRANNWLKSTE